MRLRRGLAVGFGALGVLGLAMGPADAATVTVNSVVVVTSYSATTLTFTTVGNPWKHGTTQLRVQTTSCGEQHCEWTGTFSAGDSRGNGVTGTFSSSLVVDTSTGQSVGDFEASFTVSGGVGSYVGATGRGHLQAYAGPSFAPYTGTQHFQFTT